MKDIFWRVGIVFLLVAVILASNVFLSDNDNPIVKFQRALTIGFENVAYAEAPDYLVDGTDDYVQAQTALDALPATGGKIVFFAGTYDFDNAGTGQTIARAIPNVIIEGNGYGTYFDGDGVTAVFSDGGQAKWQFRDFRTDAGWVSKTGSGSMILSCWNNTTYVNELYVGTRNIGDATTPVVAKVFASDAPLKPSATDTANLIWLVAGNADDEIQEAINTLGGVSNGTIELSTGLFTTAATITIDHSNLTLSGQGKATEIFVGDGVNAPAITISGTNTAWVTVRDLFIWGNKANNTSGDGIYINTPNGAPTDEQDANHLLSNLFISDVNDTGVEILSGTDCRYVRIEGVLVNGAGIDGFELRGTDHRCVDSQSLSSGRYGWWLGAPNTQLVNCSTGGSGSHGFEIQSTDQILTSCFSQYNTGSGFHGENASYSDVTLASCVSDLNSVSGIAGWQVTRWNVIGGRYTSNTSIGIDWMDTATDNHVSRAIITGNGTPYSSGSGVNTISDCIGYASSGDSIPKSLFDANTILMATSDNTPVATSFGAITALGNTGADEVFNFTTSWQYSATVDQSTTLYLTDPGVNCMLRLRLTKGAGADFTLTWDRTTSGSVTLLWVYNDALATLTEDAGVYDIYLWRVAADTYDCSYVTMGF